MQIGRLQNADLSGLAAAGIPAPQVLQIARQVLQGRIARKNGDLTSAIAAFRAAAAMEDQLAYMEPPYWYYPVRQSLGAALLQAGDLDGAEQAFRASLARAPNNGWALYGLAEVYQARGDQRAERAARRLLDEAWVGEPRLLDIARL